MELVAYDPGWPGMFRKEERRLRDYLPEAGRIEHFGSTAVEGMLAKPVIDILLEVDDPVSPRVRAALEKAGYHWHWRTDREPHYPFCVRFDNQGLRTHHLHVHRGDSSFWQRLLFRDLLRLDAAERNSYLALKKRVASMHPGDREAYTEAKSEYVAQAMQRARMRLAEE